ncbi:MAG: 16S rRNA (guanine(966)-N(2))-methyltransferase RsmD [Pyrinomonadaceae bacterium]
MENRRPTTNAPRPFTRNNDFRKEGDRPTGTRNFQPRDNRFQSRNDRYEPRDDRHRSGDDRQRSDNRFQSRDNRNQPRNGGDSNGKFQPRDNKFQPRGRFAPKGKTFKPWEQDRRPRIVSDMQVTDGKHRGKYLQSTASAKVRPTARRIREVMFRILFRRVRAGRFLDLCAGTGTVGIEAISRGALIGTFVERSAQMCGYIKKNLAACGIKEGHGEIFEIEVVPFLKRMSKRRRFWDVVYFDPPYDSNYDEVLAYFSRGAIIRPGGTLVIEHPAEMFFPEKFGVMRRWRVVAQGETQLSFYERQQT